MKTNTIAKFYYDYCIIVKKLIDGIGEFRKLDKSYAAVDLGSLITDGTDFGESAAAHGKLYEFFTDLKNLVNNQVLEAMYAHLHIVTYYTALDLATLIGDTDVMGDGNTGLDLKNAIAAMADLNTFLATGHYTNLCRMEYVTEKLLTPMGQTVWESGITGSQIKSVISTLEALDSHLITELDYSKLYQLI